jgi:hypothetical protein
MILKRTCSHGPTRLGGGGGRMLELVRYLRTSTVVLPEARFAGWERSVGVAVERQDIDVLVRT